jgi:hypothetical protein
MNSFSFASSPSFSSSSTSRKHVTIDDNDDDNVYELTATTSLNPPSEFNPQSFNGHSTERTVYSQRHVNESNRTPESILIFNVRSFFRNVMSRLPLTVSRQPQYDTIATEDSDINHSPDSRYSSPAFEDETNCEIGNSEQPSGLIDTLAGINGAARNTHQRTGHRVYSNDEGVDNPLDNSM